MTMAGNLDAKTVEAAKPRARRYRLSDGGGLLLEVQPSGAKVWLCRLTVAGKRRDMGLGAFPTVSLKDARVAARVAREIAARGDDPIEARKRRAREQAAARKAAAEAQARTFRSVAELCIDSQKPGWKNPRTARLWEASLARWVYPAIGDMPVGEIDRPAVLRAVGDVWRARPQTARKVLHRIAVVLRYAAAHGWRSNDNPADARLLRHAGLPALPGGRKQPSLPWTRVPAFMKALDAMHGMAPLALRLLILTALRSGEVRNARWSWVSFDGVLTLTIPGEWMKRKKTAEVQPHRVPLSHPALETLARAYSLATGTPAKPGDLPRLVPLMRDALIFPSAKRDTPLSDMALSAVMRRMNANRPEDAPPPWRDPDGREAVPHGFRASFSSWVDDTRPHEREAAERALAHEVGNKVSAAYRRSDLFDRRIRLMADWAEHCTSASRAGMARRGAARSA
jgi:integrase